MILLRLLLWLLTGLDWLSTSTGFAIAAWIAIYGLCLSSFQAPLELVYVIPTLLAIQVHHVLQEWGY